MENTVVSALAKIVVAKLFSLLEKKYEQWKVLEDDIGFIKRELRMIDGAMRDQLSQKGDLSAVQSISMEEMRDLAHDIEDCLDRFLPCPACEGEASFLDRLTAAVTSSQFTTEIQKLKKRLKEAHQLMSDYNVNGGQPTISGGTTAASSSNTGTTEVELVGMDKPKQELLELLEDVEGQPEQLSVISVVGFGGSGKTTLARAVYDCPDVVGRFPGRAWVVASEHKNDIRGLLSTLLNQLRPEDQRRDVHSGVQQLQQVQTDIRQCLNTKRYLIVFDDIEEQQWDCIKSTFPVQTRSRVIVTTTIRPVANACSYGKGHVYNMRTLDVNHSKDLLEALLDSAGLEWDPTPIVEKCDGLPLALVSVANFLRRKNDLTEIYCKQVCRSLGYHMEKEYVFTELRQVLMNNYSNLSGHPLKTCLLYTSVFPNGRPIRRNSLIRRWLAEGYVQCQYPRSDMEVADDNFQELIDLKLHGEVNRFPRFVTSLCGLTELCLSSTNLIGHDLSNLCTLCHLLYLKLVEADLRDFIIKNGDFPSLRRLCLVVQIPILPTIEQGALPYLVSLQLLCKDLVGLSGIRIEYHDYIEEVVLDSTVSRETIENWENEAKKHPNRPKVSFLKRVDPTDTESTVKYAATEGPTHGTGSSVTLNKRKFHAVQLCSVNELNSALKQRKVSDSSPDSTEPSSAGNGATPSSLR